MEQAELEEFAGHQRQAAGLEYVGGDVVPPRLEVGQDGDAGGDAVEVLQLQVHAGLVGDGHEVEDGVGGAASGSDGGNGVLDGLAGDDVARADVAIEQVHHEAAGFEGGVRFAAVHGGHDVGAGWADAQEVERGGHGVGGELAAAGAGAGAGGVFDFHQFVGGELAGGVGADAFEHLLDGDVLAAELAGRDAAAVEGQARDVQASEDHGAGGDGLVAADDDDEGVKGVADGGDFDGVGNDLAADQGGAHAFGAHGDAVADGDGVDLHGGAAGGADALLDALGHAPVVEVAGHGFDPLMRHADDGPGQVLIGEADGLELGAGRGAGRAIGHGGAVALARIGHGCS